MVEALDRMGLNKYFQVTEVYFYLDKEKAKKDVLLASMVVDMLITHVEVISMLTKLTLFLLVTFRQL